MYLKLGKPYIDLINYLQSFSPLCIKKKKKKMKTGTCRRHLNIQLAGRTSKENKLS